MRTSSMRRLQMQRIVNETVSDAAGAVFDEPAEAVTWVAEADPSGDGQTTRR